VTEGFEEVSRSLSENPADLQRTVGRLILTRWVAGLMVIAGTFLASVRFGLDLPATQLYLVGASILAYNGLLSLMWRRDRDGNPAVPVPRSQRLLILQILLDWLALLVFIHLTGGATSPAIPVLGIHMLMVTILLPSPAQYVYLAMGLAGLALVAVLEYQGALAHYSLLPAIPADIYQDPLYVAAQIGFFAIAASATVVLASDVMARLRRREQQVTALLATAQALSATLSLDEVLNRLARNAALALQAPSASIRLLEEDGESLPMVASFGLSRAYQDKGQVEVSRSLLDREALAGQVVIIHDAATDERIQYPVHVRQEGIRSVIVAPILGRRGPLGVLRVYSGQSAAFDERAGEFVLAIARQGAAAMENALSFEALQQEDQARAQFVRTITHELRSPVSGAQSLLRALLHQQAGNLTDQQLDILTRVEVRLNILTELVEDLLELAKSKTAGFQAELTSVDLGAALSAIAARFEPEAKAKGIDLSYTGPEGGVLTAATEEGLGLVFGNLISNAIKYTPAGGKVSVELASMPEGTTVQVRDSGIGIPADEQSHLWEEFWRASNARQSQVPGTGLGLSIVKRLVESFGGLISFHSTQDRGTTFTVVLPPSSG
jgi:signal transduction histidine kinase